MSKGAPATAVSLVGSVEEGAGAHLGKRYRISPHRWRDKASRASAQRWICQRRPSRPVTVSELHPLKALTTTDLSASIAGDAVVGVIPQALVGPRNRLLLMTGVGQHHGDQAGSAQQAAEHDCDAAESQSRTGQWMLGLISWDIMAARSRPYRAFRGAGFRAGCMLSWP